MNYNKIPGTDIEVSELCLGSMTFGSPVEEKDAIDLIRYAKEEYGINFIDTANMYEGYRRTAGSAGGVAENIIGKATSAKRHDYVIASKVGMKVGDRPEDQFTSPDAIRIQVRKSLKRLKTDYIDVYYLHCYDPHTPPEEILYAIDKELKAGTIRAWGVSNYTFDQLKTLLETAENENIKFPSLVQPPLSLLKQDSLKNIIPYCEEKQIAVVPYQILQGGLLTGKYKQNQTIPEHSRMAEKPEWMNPLSDETADVLQQVRRQADKENLSMTQYSIRWVLSQAAVISAIIGVKNKKQIDEAASAISE